MTNSNETDGGNLVLEVFEGDGEQPWRWHAKAPNGEILGGGEGHPSAGNAERSLNTLLGYVVSGRFEVKLPQAPDVRA